jgi:uncharacterized protein (DUF2235 family)
MPRNLCIFSDGTGQGGVSDGRTNTNVYKLYIACRRADPDRRRQAAFYDPGLGSNRPGGPAVGWLRWAQNLVSRATGLGISRNIKDCYSFLIRTYEPGDSVFLFGFSRGAYTVRSLGGVLKLCGIPARSAAGASPRTNRKARAALVEEAVEAVYKTYGRDPETQEKRRRLGAEYRARYAAHEVAPHFIGVWDTVRALGLPGTGDIFLWRHEFHDATLDPRVPHARQALAIDENRDAYAPVLWETTEQDIASGRIKQPWFAGAHSDIGGGYVEKGLSDIALEWIVDEAKQIAQPLLVDEAALALTPDPLGFQHDELKTSWMPWRRGLRRLTVRDAVAAPVVEDRFRAVAVPFVDGRRPYRPEGLRDHPSFRQYY